MNRHVPVVATGFMRVGILPGFLALRGMLLGASLRQNLPKTGT